MDMMQTIVDMVTACAIVLAGIITACGAIAAAKFGLGAWRKEMHGKAKFEIARESVRLAYESRHRFESARSVVFPSEAADRKRSPSEEEGERKLRDEQFARMRRMDNLATTLIRMREVVWESQVLFGHQIACKLQELNTQYGKVFQKLSSAIIAYYDLKIKVDFKDLPLSGTDMKKFKEIEAIVYFMPDDKSPGAPMYSGTDDFSDKIEQLTKKWVEVFDKVIRNDQR